MLMRMVRSSRNCRLGQGNAAMEPARLEFSSGVRRQRLRGHRLLGIRRRPQTYPSHIRDPLLLLINHFAFSQGHGHEPGTQPAARGESNCVGDASP